MHIFYCKVVQKYLKNVDQVEFLTTRKHISQDFVETTGPTKNYFMLIASLFSDNIGLFYDILSVDFSFACKQPSILNWTHPFWTGENVICNNKLFCLITFTHINLGICSKRLEITAHNFWDMYLMPSLQPCACSQFTTVSVLVQISDLCVLSNSIAQPYLWIRFEFF